MTGLIVERGGKVQITPFSHEIWAGKRGRKYGKEEGGGRLPTEVARANGAIIARRATLFYLSDGVSNSISQDSCHVQEISWMGTDTNFPLNDGVENQSIVYATQLLYQSNNFIIVQETVLDISAKVKMRSLLNLAY